MGELFNEYVVFIGNDEKIGKKTAEMVTQHCECI